MILFYFNFINQANLLLYIYNFFDPGFFWNVPYFFDPGVFFHKKRIQQVFSLKINIH